MIHIPTHQPLAIIAVAIISRHLRKLLCVANDDQSLALMEAVLRDEYHGDYRLSVQHGSRRCHEVRERGVVRRWHVDHAPKSRDERLAEIEAADAFEPMEEWSEAA